LLAENYPACTMTPGWLSYSDEKLGRLAREAVEEGFTIDQTQGRRQRGRRRTPDEDRLCCGGRGWRVAVDANQRWDAGPAIDWMRALAPYDPYWIEEPTSPDDVLGDASIRRAIQPIKVATGPDRAWRGGEVLAASVAEYSYPDGPVWAARRR
jgi:L-fuconate dehydratase